MPASPTKSPKLPLETCTDVLDKFGIPRNVNRRDYRYVADYGSTGGKLGNLSTASKDPRNPALASDYVDYVTSPTNANK